MEDRPPREGDVHRVLTIAGHQFVIRYGYYTDADRASNALCPIYPDFQRHPVFTSDGRPLTAALQDACAHYRSRAGMRDDGWCADCAHFADENADISICDCAAWRLHGGNRIHQKEEICETEPNKTRIGTFSGDDAALPEHHRIQRYKRNR